MEKNFFPNLEKYEQQEKLLANRSSYSKTDPDATFMQMKEDHMKNGACFKNKNNRVVESYNTLERYKTESQGDSIF